MGVDVIGQNGTIFSRSWWSWRPIAIYCFEVAPQVCENSDHQGYWGFNNGSMTSTEAKELASVLQTELNMDRTKQYAKDREARISALPDEPCDLCRASGTRNDWNTGHKNMKCNKCDGAGKVRPFETMYTFNVSTIQEFADFLRTCGGFELH
jgi:hypothetical protein